MCSFGTQKETEGEIPSQCQDGLKKEGRGQRDFPGGCSLCRLLGRSLARSDLDGRGECRKRGGSAVEKQGREVKKAPSASE